MRIWVGSSHMYAAVRNSQSQTHQPVAIGTLIQWNNRLHQENLQGIRCYNFLQRYFASFITGTLSPLLGIGAQVSLQFGSNELIKKLLFKIYGEFLLEDENQAKNLPISLVLASGLLTGIPSSLSVVIILAYKRLLQIIQEF